MKVRLIRLYPLYALGLALGVIDSGISIFTGRVYGKAAMITAAVLNAFLLPALFTASNREYFPFNMPSWSLFMEIVMNLLHALLLRNRTRQFLMAVLICSGLGFAVSSVCKGTTDVGIDGIYGFTRLIFSYVLGMILLHLWKTRHWRLRMPTIVLPILLAVPMTLSGAHPLVVTNLLMIALVFPVVVLAAAECQPRSNTLMVATYLGSASYAIYILHSPVIPLIQIVWNRLFRADMYRYAPWSGFAYLGIVITAAGVVDTFYDAPARKFLTRKMIAATTQA